MSQQEENKRCHSEKYLFTEYTHVDTYLRRDKNREQGPVLKLLLYALDESKIKVHVGKSGSALLLSTTAT